ncbi:hypothetical protein MRX96_032756 [Rhipicephalus microplus]
MEEERLKKLRAGQEMRKSEAGESKVLAPMSRIAVVCAPVPAVDEVNVAVFNRVENTAVASPSNGVPSSQRDPLVSRCRVLTCRCSMGRVSSER